MRNVAIIGGGFSGVAVVNSIVRSAVSSGTRSVTLTLFEPSPIGPGKAYDLGSPDSFLLNQELGFMGSINLELDTTDRQDFFNWVNQRPELRADYPAYNLSDPHEFVPRNLYGRYLADRYATARTYATRHGIQIIERKVCVDQIKRVNKQFLVSAGQHQSYYDAVILATGVYFQAPDPAMVATGRYFEALDHKAYLSDSIRNNGVMLILGTGLSAYDAAITALESGHYSKVIMASRRGILRKVRSQTEPYVRKHLTIENMEKAAGGKDRPFSLKTFIELAKAELSEAYGRPIDWASHYRPEQVIAMLERDIDTAKTRQTLIWHSVLTSTTDAEKRAFFFRLNDADKAEFLRRYWPLYQMFSAPMSIRNAMKLLGFINTGQLEVVGGAQDVVYLPDEKKFQLWQSTDHGAAPIAFDDPAGHVEPTPHPVTADVMVGATGPGRSVGHLPVYAQLLADGLVSAHPLGGIRTNEATRQVIDSSGNPVENLYALGQMSCGESLLTLTSNRLSDIALQVGPQVVRKLPPVAITSPLPPKVIALYTGTFDPFHVGHAEALQLAHGALSFDRVIIAAIRHNPNKPNAAPWEHRVAMIKSATRGLTKTFGVDIQPIDYIWPEQIAQFTTRHCRDGQLIRVVGSDSLIEFISNPRLWPVLGLCHHAVVVRKIAGLEQVEKAVAGLPDDVRARLSYEVVGFHQAPHEARRVRQDIDESYRKRLIKADVLNYAKQHHLY